jgi:CheY-like chemotaxis protein
VHAPLPPSRPSPVSPPVVLLDDEAPWLLAYQQLLSPALSAEALITFTHPDAMLAWPQLAQAQAFVLDYDLRAAVTGLDVAYHLSTRYGLPPQRIVLCSATPEADIGSHPFAWCPKTQASRLLLPRLQAVLASVLS